MSRFRGFLWLYLLFFASAMAEAQDGGAPIFQPIEEFGRFGPQNSAPAAIMDEAEERAFEQAVSSMERFPAYFYSGCHDRAHAAYLLLPQTLRAKVRKIWVVGPSRFTAAIPGTIRLRADDPASRAVNWGYHVALAIDTASGMRVYDPALHPQGTITREQWFALMSMPRLSIWMVTRGNLYLFNYATLDAAARNGNQVWNGNANNYEGYEPQFRILPDNLARDAIGVEAMRGGTCAAIRERVTDPQALLDFLSGRGAEAPGCTASIARFRSERERWRARLPA